MLYFTISIFIHTTAWRYMYLHLLLAQHIKGLIKTLFGRLLEGLHLQLREPYQTLKCGKHLVKQKLSKK
jgi:hypothetical protein